MKHINIVISIGAVLLFGIGAYYSYTNISKPTTLNEVSDESEVGPVWKDSHIGPSFFGCYVQQGEAVFSDQDLIATDRDKPRLSSEAKIVTDADNGSFEDMSMYGICFGKDKNHVYQEAEVLAWADPQTFAMLSYHSNVILFKNGPQIMRYAYERGDPADDSIRNEGTFSEVIRGDSATFEVLTSDHERAPWAKDKNNVYCIGDAIPGAIPSSAKVINEGTQLQVQVGGRILLYERCEVVS